MAYPGTLDSFTANTDDVDDVLAADMNAVQDAIVAIQTELGTDPAGSLTDLKTRLIKSISAAGLLNFAASTVLTISSGSITATGNWHRVDTESAAATDDLDTITAGADGQVLMLRIVASTRNVVIRHGIGNIVCGGAANVTLDLTSDLAYLIYDSNLAKWICLGAGSSSSSTDANTAYYSYLCALLEPDAIEAAQLDSFTYVIADDETKYVLGSWYTRLGAAGRWEVRDPRTPVSLRNVTLTGLGSNASAIILNPALATYTNARTTYFTRLKDIAELPTQYVSGTATNTFYKLLPGPYGIIITNATCFDFAWIVIKGPGGAAMNLGNEVGDTTIQRVSTQLFLPMSKNYCIGMLTSTQGTAGNLAGISYVILPATWSGIPDLTAYDFRSDFMEATIDTTTEWTKTESTAGNIAIDTSFQWCKFLGNSNWGANGVISKTSITRAAAKVFQCDVFVGTDANIVVGFHDGAGLSVSDFSHGVQLRADGYRYIYENANIRENAAETKFSSNNIYRVRITLQSTNTAAKYEMQGGSEYDPIGGTTWTDITPGTTSSSTTPLYAGISVYSGTAYVSDVKIY